MNGHRQFQGPFMRVLEMTREERVEGTARADEQSGVVQTSGGAGSQARGRPGPATVSSQKAGA